MKEIDKNGITGVKMNSQVGRRVMMIKNTP